MMVMVVMVVVVGEGEGGGGGGALRVKNPVTPLSSPANTC